MIDIDEYSEAINFVPIINRSLYRLKLLFNLKLRIFKYVLFKNNCYRYGKILHWRQFNMKLIGKIFQSRSQFVAIEETVMNKCTDISKHDTKV